MKRKIKEMLASQEIELKNLGVVLANGEQEDIVDIYRAMEGKYILLEDEDHSFSIEASPREQQDGILFRYLDILNDKEDVGDATIEGSGDGESGNTPGTPS